MRRRPVRSSSQCLSFSLSATHDRQSPNNSRFVRSAFSVPPHAFSAVSATPVFLSHRSILILAVLFHRFYAIRSGPSTSSSTVRFSRDRRRRRRSHPRAFLSTMHLYFCCRLKSVDVNLIARVLQLKGWFSPARTQVTNPIRFPGRRITTFSYSARCRRCVCTRRRRRRNTYLGRNTLSPPHRRVSPPPSSVSP